jgi:acetyltransferase-like isoleucine patch superfamily enzyme
LADSLTRRRTWPDRLWDAIFELTGAYRVRIWMRRGSIAASASVKSPSLLSIGRGIAIQRGVALHCGGKAWSGHRGGVSIGNGVVVGPYCVIYGAGGVHIGEYVHLGPGVKLMTQGGVHDNRRVSSSPSLVIEPITIGAGSWVGSGAVIVAGTFLGRCVTVGPNSVVSGVVPDNALVAGNPGRIILHQPPIG